MRRKNKQRAVNDRNDRHALLYPDVQLCKAADALERKNRPLAKILYTTALEIFYSIDSMAERLRRLIRNHIRYPGAGSSPAAVEV